VGIVRKAAGQNQCIVLVHLGQFLKATMSSSLGGPMQNAGARLRQSSAAASLVPFLLVGGLAALCFVGLSTLMVGLRTGIPDWLMSALCYAIMIVPVYLAQRRFAFRTGVPHRLALPRYITVQVVGLALAALFSFICYRLLGMPSPVAASLVIILTSGINFALLRLWAFAESA
jgi:putative flippase GtrA